MARPVSNPMSRYQRAHVEWSDEHGEAPPAVRLEVIDDDSRSILAHNDSPDVGFDWSVNPYRGCFHACAYCYARPSHEMLGFLAGTDFERRLVVKRDAARLLEVAFARPSWKGDRILFSGNTDCYQPLERELGLTRACLEVCERWRNPVAIVTKSHLVARDVDLLAALHRQAQATVTLSIPFLDRALAHAIEPNAPPPSLRLRAMAELADAGIPVGVNIAPCIPGLNDREIPSILEAARDAGASWAGLLPLRLPGPVARVFADRLRAALPERAPAVLSKVVRMRGGRLNDPRFGSRMCGQGPEWAATRALFALWRKRLGYGTMPPALRPSPFRRPGSGGQRTLF